MDQNKNKYFNHATEAGQFYDQYQAYQAALNQIETLNAQLEAAQAQLEAAQAILMASLNEANLDAIHFNDLNVSVINQPETTKIRTYDWDAIATDFNDKIYPYLDPSVQNTLNQNGWNDSSKWYIKTVDPQISNQLTKLKISNFFQPYYKSMSTIRAKIALKPLNKAPRKSKSASI